MLDLIYLLVVGLSLFFLYYYKRSFGSINFYSIYLGVMLVYGLISSLLIYFDFFSGYYFWEPVEKNVDVKNIGVILHLWGLVGIFIPIFFVDLITENKIFNFYTDSIGKKKLFLRKSHVFFYFAVYLLISMIYLYESNPGVGYLRMVGESKEYLAFRRLELTQFYHGNGFVKTISFSLSLLNGFLFGYCFKNRKVIIKGIFVLMFISCVLSMFVLTVTGEKAPILLFCILTFFGYNYSSHNYIKIKFFILVTALAVSVFQLQFGFSFESLLGFVERIFLAQSVAVYLSTEQYLNHVDLIGFNSMESNLFRYLFDINNYVKPASDQYVDLFYPGLREVGTWNVNGIYAHEALSNFGLLITIISPFLIGVAYVVFLSLYRRLFLNMYFILFYVYWMFSYVSLLTSFNRIIFNTESIFMFLFLAGIGLFFHVLDGNRDAKRVME